MMPDTSIIFYLVQNKNTAYTRDFLSTFLA